MGAMSAAYNFAYQTGRTATQMALNYVETKSLSALSRTSPATSSLRKEEIFVNRGTSFAGSKRAPLDYAPYQKMRNESAIINGRKYTGHSLDRMQDRGFMPSVIENTISTGRVSPADFPGGSEYYDPVNKIRAIVGENGKIITIIPGRG